MKWRDDIHGELFHHFCRDGSEADCHVVPRVFLLPLSEDRNDAVFPPVLRHFSCSPWPVKDYGEGLSNNIFQLAQHSWVHLIKTHGFVGVKFA